MAGKFRTGGRCEAGIYRASSETLPHSDLRTDRYPRFCVLRLLSIPQQRPAAAMRSAPSERARETYRPAAMKVKRPPRG